MPENPFNRWSARERSARGFGSYDCLGLASDIISELQTPLLSEFGGRGARQMKVAIIGTYRSRGSDRVAKIGTDLGGVDDADR